LKTLRMEPLKFEWRNVVGSGGYLLCGIQTRRKAKSSNSQCNQFASLWSSEIVAPAGGERNRPVATSDVSTNMSFGGRAHKRSFWHASGPFQLKCVSNLSLWKGSWWPIYWIQRTGMMATSCCRLRNRPSSIIEILGITLTINKSVLIF
jgi:hypothetical protein